jgi:ABC-type Fe3+ transport system substrate-binding protein
MKTRTKIIFAVGGLGLIGLLSLSAVPAARAASAPTKVDSLDELYEKAKKEGGKLNLYASLSANSVEVIVPAFSKRFPGLSVDHTDATGDKLIARIVAEGRGGRVIADTFGGGLPHRRWPNKSTEPLAIPEAAYRAVETDTWIATDTNIHHRLEYQFGQKGREAQSSKILPIKVEGLLMGEPRLPCSGLSQVKYKSDDKAVDLVKRIAMNQVEFHRGHSQLIEFLVAGQRPVCFTCYAHQFPPRMKKGAPIVPLLTEGVGEVGGSVGVLKGAPHPNTALLWARWVASEEGQRSSAAPARLGPSTSAHG